MITARRPRILIAGLGNIFLGDDAFGVEVVRRLSGRHLPEGVRAVDFGIRGFDLACALADGYDAVILVDAYRHGKEPGSICVLAPQACSEVASDQTEALDAHALDPARVLRLVPTVGGTLPLLRLVGCEPASFDTEQGLSGPVAAALDRAIEAVDFLVAEILDSHHANR